MSCTDKFEIEATIVANEFIDKYMPEANGDYVKVYLYLLKNRAEGVEIAVIAEVLRLTEGDVRRAVRYWEDKGIVSVGRKVKRQTDASAKTAAKEDAAEADTEITETIKEIEITEPEDKTSDIVMEDDESHSGTKEAKAEKSSRDCVSKSSYEAAAGDEDGAAASKSSRTKNNASEIGTTVSKELYMSGDGKGILDSLNSDAEFIQLLIIVQKYMAKSLSERELEVLAYLYDGLHLSCDVLDYLVAYCVEKGHNNMRYIEKTGIDWAKTGISDVNAAKRRTDEFDRMVSDKGKRTRTRTERQGITRNMDLDDLIKAQVLEKI